TAQMGGVCTLINSSCTFIDQSGQITTDIHTIWQHAKILHEVTMDDTSWSTHLWEALRSWLPNLNWLKQLLMEILLLGIIILCTFIFSQCFFWCCQGTTVSYDDWKRRKLRQSRKRNIYKENK
ncbi:ERVV2 protein, partial [Promerops cafer]|nr:ERVV2 protein [Promerops cafer]